MAAATSQPDAAAATAPAVKPNVLCTLRLLAVLRTVQSLQLILRHATRIAAHEPKGGKFATRPAGHNLPASIK